MRITGDISEAVVLEELGSRIKQFRIAQNLTQAELAIEAGVSRPTVERVESGSSAGLSTFIRLLRALGLLSNLDAVIPAALPSPLQHLDLGKARQRARSSKPKERSSDWSWGDEE